MTFYRCFGDGIVARHYRPHPLGFLLPQPGAAFDIGEEKSDWGLFRHVIHVPSIRQGWMLLRRYLGAWERTALRSIGLRFNTLRMPTGTE